MGYRPGRPPPPSGFQGEGLLALSPGEGAPTLVWSAPEPLDRVPSIRAGVVDGHLAVTADGDVVESAYPGEGTEAALGRWAEHWARRLGVGALRSLPAVWCSWYHYFNQVAEPDVLENMRAIDELGLDVGVIQIDDGHQAEIGDWLERSPRFPRPLAELAERVHATGRRAGLWVAPLIASPHSRLATEHPEWVVDGAYAGHNWGVDLRAVDVTHPGAAEWLQQVFRQFREWGFDYFKLDFMYAGALEGRRHGQAAGVAAYREALRLIREAAGPDALLIGSGAPMLPSVGMVDAMRVGPDIALYYEPSDGDMSAPSQLSAVLAGRARAFQQGRFWVNDPDCLLTRPELDRREEWAEHVERFGGLRASSDRLVKLDQWGVETTRRLLRPASIEPFEL
jgi:alpha-galactosidase